MNQRLVLVHADTETAPCVTASGTMLLFTMPLTNASRMLILGILLGTIIAIDVHTVRTTSE